MLSFIEKAKNRLKSKSKQIEKEVEIEIEKEMKISPKKQPAKRIVFLVFGALISILALVVLIFAVIIYGFRLESVAVKTVARVIPYPAAFTSSGVITMAEYYHEKDYINHFYAATKQNSTINQNDLKKQIITQLIENKIVNNEAIKMKFSTKDEEVDLAINKIYESNGGMEEVKKTLIELYDLSVDQFKNLVRSQLIREKISNEAIEKVTARHILIRVDEDATEEKVNEAKANIDKLAAEILGGASFEEVAKRSSEDVGSNEQGGALEPFGREEMVKEFEDVVFSQPLNEVSKPFRSSFGWHIVKVEKKTGFIHASFDSWLSGLKSRSIILIFYKTSAGSSISPQVIKVIAGAVILVAVLFCGLYFNKRRRRKK